MPDYILREHYLDMLRGFRDRPVIKVITGMRRSGKSTVLEMFRDEIVSSGVPEEDTVHLKLGDELESAISDHRELIDAVKERFVPSGGKYIFLDEVQDVAGWERAVETFFERGADVYITGSNSSMLSTELSTKLSGRHVEIEILPLSFREFLLFREQCGPDAPLEEKFSEYMRWGGLPGTVLMSGSRRDLVAMLISGTYDTVFVKDVMQRRSIRNPSTVENISRFLMKNIGDRTSVRNAAGYLVSKGVKASAESIESYIGALCDAKLFRRARRRDSKTKEYLRTSDKFYANDLGMRNVAIGYDDRDIDGILENMVYMELLYRYGNACVMNVDGKEVDFVSYDSNRDPMYFQVSVSVVDPATMRRELAPLKALDDNYPKSVITLDRYPYGNVDGIRIVNAVDFLSGSDL